MNRAAERVLDWIGAVFALGWLLLYLWLGPDDDAPEELT